MKTQQKWTESQLKYIRFVARGKQDTAGKDYTDEEFAKLLGVDRTTLWRWTQLPGFAEDLFEESLRQRLPYLPKLIDAQIISAGKKGKGGDTQAFMALMRQWNLLKADKVDSKTEHSGSVSFNNSVPLENP